MASIEYRAKTTRVIAYVNKEKQTFPLGRVTKKTAERFANNIDTLLHEHRCNLPISREVSNWLADPLYDLLTEHGLAEPRAQVSTLAAFIDSYIAGRSDVTERRLGKFRNARDRMVGFFGDVELDSVTPGAADEYARSLLSQLAPVTAHKECQIAAQFFRHAFRKGLIERNPFDGVTVGRATNDDRRFFVSREVIQRVLDKCPNWQWRTVVALARYGGLRCGSEVALLRWSDIHWDAERFTVTSPKTKRYGKATRVVPSSRSYDRSSMRRSRWRKRVRRGLSRCSQAIRERISARDYERSSDVRVWSRGRSHFRIADRAGKPNWSSSTRHTLSVLGWGIRPRWPTSTT